MDSAGNPLTVARSRIAVRRHLAATPGRLRLAMALLALSAIVFGIVGVHAAGERRRAGESVVATERLLVSAVELSVSLSNTHATAAFSFLRGKPETPRSRRLYLRQLREASVGVARLAREIGTSSDSGPAVRRITQTLPVYAGLIENARANNRQGFPVGGAYLRKASKTMRNTILPGARDLYEIEAQKLTQGYRGGVSGEMMLAVALAGCALLMLLTAVQVYLARVTRRILNPALVMATALLLGLMVWIGVAFTLQQNALAQAQQTGSDPVELLTATRILASRAQADESIALAARGGGEEEPRLKDVDRGFQSVTRPIGGLLAQAGDIAGAPVDGIERAYRTYLNAHLQVVKEVKRGNFTRAEVLAVSRGADGTPSTKAAGDALNRALDRGIQIAQDRFVAAARRADAALASLAGGTIPVLTALCALLALFGVRQRLEEYR
jgi:hypothetical protein